MTEIIILNSIIKLLKSNNHLMSIVSNIYDIIPNKVSLPYVHIYISNLKTLNAFNNNMSKIQLSCKIYCYHFGTLNKTLTIITNLLAHYKSNTNDLKYKIIPEYTHNIHQNNDIIYALLNFTILAEKTHVNTITN
ncbi:hypothetical protein DRF75_02410 [Ehrlichia minasensis]|uniref:DUF3168 domain-containing protein n=1 Tax=Ehrlichia minasensis TaxID=1242993 RepID=A0A4Q6I4K1_9RICK|nr:hypothetical protein DRF75_02410 [Ehrlichia minasensis]CEI85449.1 Uncharacterized protein ehr_00845 [Ehrlichia minasensis]